MSDARVFASMPDSEHGSLLGRLSALQPHERRILVTAIPALLIARVGLWLLPLPRLQRLLGRLADAIPAPYAHTDYAERAARAVACASWLVPFADCRSRALATLLLLRRRGLPASVREGIRVRPEGIQRHTWVEHNGRVIIGGPASLVAQFTSVSTAPGGVAKRAPAQARHRTAR